MRITIGDCLWSPFLNRHIIVKTIKSDDNWEFEMDGTTLRANTPINYFEKNCHLIAPRIRRSEDKKE